MFCKSCEKLFLKECNFNKHRLTSKMCNKVEELMNKNKELLDIIEKLKKTKVEGDDEVENIVIDDLAIEKLTIMDLIEYGKGIAKFIIKYSNIINKLVIKNKRIMIYKIDNKMYKDNGNKLVYFIIFNYQDKILNFLKDKYENLDVFNDHIKRMLNIKNIEINEILSKTNINNDLSNEIINYIFENDKMIK